MTTIADLFDNNNHLITTVAGTITGYPQYIQDTVAAMLTDKYFDAADKILLTRFGERPARSDDSLVVNMEILSYIIVNARKFEKCLEYIAAEYNPVENYEGREEEDFTNTYDEVNRHGSNDKGATTLTLNYGAQSTTEAFSKGQQTIGHTLQYGPTSTTTIDAYDKQKTVQDLKYGPESSSETVTIGTSNSTQQTAPFDTEDFKNASKTIESGRSDGNSKSTTGHDDKVTTNIDARNDSQSTTSSARTDTDNVIDGSRQDSTTKTAATYIDTQGQTAQLNPFTDVTDEREDTIHRELYKHGNLGVLSAAELILKDMQAWDDFQWIVDMAHDIANIIGSGVYAL